jgi:multimeric flavodoxin WrbA
MTYDNKLGRCVINDDVNAIMAKVLKADVICRRLLI